tara:strand:+ start:710 stop:988 length:279 start_codon:yes stop_codon:yes gene_type:complete
VRITKTIISKSISSNINISNKDASLLFDKFLDIFKEFAASKKDIKIKGFGTFKNHKTPKRHGRNPKTKESYIIPPRNKLVLRASKGVKDILN